MLFNSEFMATNQIDGTVFVGQLIGPDKVEMITRYCGNKHVVIYTKNKANDFLEWCLNHPDYTCDVL